MIYFRGKYSNNFNKTLIYACFFLNIVIVTLKFLSYKMVFYTI